ncbi:hypothetical protein ACFO1V_06355 [Daeguia caeni]|uniref:Uncharacterized protein n=2 Tax=Daeguia caeni TaxID=439612 RepID=A0ABV9H5R2_9HYPH
MTATGTAQIYMMFLTKYFSQLHDFLQTRHHAARIVLKISQLTTIKLLPAERAAIGQVVCQGSPDFHGKAELL